MWKILFLVVLFFGMSSEAFAEDIAAGERVFKRCRACHVVDSEKNKTGPHLFGIVGRRAASVESYKRYSDALKNSGLVWDEEEIDGYITNPREYLKGTTMVFKGLKSEEDRRNLIAYLKSLQ